MIETSADYSDPLDVIFDDWDHLYEEIGSRGSLSNILGSSLPPKAPTPVLKRRPLAERSVNLPNPNPSKLPNEKKEDLRSRKDRFLFWKSSKKGDENETSLKTCLLGRI